MLVKECKDAFVLAEGEEVLMVAPMTTSHIDDEAGVVGDLTITSKNVHWISKEADGRGSFQVDFFSLLMHALSRDTTHFASECIYCQIGSADDEESTELRLVPADAAQLEGLFEALTRAASMNPDPTGDNDDNDDFIYDEDEVNRGAQQAMLANFDDMLDTSGVEAGEDEALDGKADAGQFDDAE